MLVYDLIVWFLYVMYWYVQYVNEVCEWEEQQDCEIKEQVQFEDDGCIGDIVGS